MTETFLALVPSFLSPDTAKWMTLAVFVITFVFILYRRFNIAYVSLAAAVIMVVLGVVGPGEAFFTGVDWDVLAIYWGYGMLASFLTASNIPKWLANRVVSRITQEKYALLVLCVIAMILSSFMANPSVVIILAPLAIELATRMNGNLFVYLIALAAASNIVTTVTMVADPPALIMASQTGMSFFEFYWFQGKVGLGTISVIGILAAIFVLLLTFRKLNNKVALQPEEVEITFKPVILLVVSVAALAFIPWESLGVWNHRGLVGLILGLVCLAFAGRNVKNWLKEYDWNSIFFLIGIFILIFSVNKVGLLEDFANLLINTGISSPALYLGVIIWVSVLLSSFIDNVPYTVIMLPVCSMLASSLGVNPFPFYFGMLIGTGMGGNLTPVGATANVLACGMLEKRGYRIKMGSYIKIAWPFTIAAVAVSHVLLQLIWL
ncbi:MAG: SLC13 family permease [Dehalococcoidales bacterium]|jgi:Na+/H+ antiporter NhaD/arsenite permease-like protein|nr:SLC13 family permease [Dehalococcoidales bacterium]MDX9986633.1 SLC13 family permease [Dehalococcoidales bacterium]